MMKRIINTLLIATMALGLNAQVTIDRTKAPLPGPAPKLNIGKAINFQLENGLKVIVVENHKLPKVSFQLTVDMDPVLEEDKVGYASMAGDLISAGTATMTKSQIDEEVDFIGGSLSTFSNGMFASCLTKHQDKLLSLVSDMLLNPAFPQEELEKLKNQATSALKSSKTNPNAIIGNVGSVLRNGPNHPYGELQNKAHIEAINIEDCKLFYKTYFRPNISYLVIVGDITAQQARKLATKYFGKWEKAEVPRHAYKQPTADWDTRVAFVNKPGSVQSVINVTYPVSLKPGDADELTAKVANAILGGGVFSGRLMQNLREDKAFTYGARSSLRSGKLVGSFTAHASVRNEVTDSSITEFMLELNKMANEKVKQSELDLIKNNMNGTFALSLERPQTIARFALNIERYGLPKDYYDTYLERLAKITIDDIARVSKKYIRPQNAIILVVGNKEECAHKLAQFAKSGKVELYDFQANPLVEKVAKALPDGLTGDKVYEDYIFAITGETNMKKAVKKFKKIKDITTIASAKMEQMGQSFTLVMTTKAKSSGMSKMEIKIQEMGMVVQSSVYNNGKGYSKNMQTGKKNLEGDELERAKEQSIIDKDVKMKELGYSMKLISIEEINGKDAYKVEVKDKKGDLSYDYFDLDSKFKVYSTSSSKGPDGEMVASTAELSDYREVNGIKYPYKRLVMAAGQEIDFTVTKIEINSKIDNSEFELD
ncbi:MAG: insulinase family protein [Flavobacteriales bacterium]|nr:insulinase family protein [Flavobacteriales bacterium]